MIEFSYDTSTLINFVRKRIANVTPGSPAIHNALTRIGLYVSSLAKINVRKKNLIDTGRLINSIRYEFFKEGNVEGVQIGSFNVPYAHVHEFGYRGQVSIPAHVRRIDQVYGRSIPEKSINIRAHSRQMNIPARPYLRPAVKRATPYIIDELRKSLIAKG